MTLTDAERMAIREAARQTAAGLPPLDEEQKATLRILLEPVRINHSSATRRVLR